MQKKRKLLNRICPTRACATHIYTQIIICNCSRCEWGFACHSVALNEIFSNINKATGERKRPKKEQRIPASQLNYIVNGQVEVDATERLMASANDYTIGMNE